jgi:hypothetical protein
MLMLFTLNHSFYQCKLQEYTIKNYESYHRRNILGIFGINIILFFILCHLSLKHIHMVLVLPWSTYQGTKNMVDAPLNPFRERQIG